MRPSKQQFCFNPQPARKLAATTSHAARASCPEAVSILSQPVSWLQPSRPPLGGDLSLFVSILSQPVSWLQHLSSFSRREIPRVSILSQPVSWLQPLGRGGPVPLQRGFQSSASP